MMTDHGKDASVGRDPRLNACRFAKVIALVLFAVCWPLKSHAAELTVEWDPPSDGITTGYILFYGTASHSYSQQVDVGNTSSYAVKNLLDGTTYYFAVSAYDATGITSDPSTEVSGTTAPAVPPVPPVVTALALSADVASPQVVGTTVTWFSTATGGAAPYQYRWWLYDGNVWSAATEWTTTSTWSWTPTVANGAYVVGVWARGAGNSTDAPELSTYVPFTIAPLAPLNTTVTIQADVVSPQIAGSTILWSATVSGGAAPYQYRWWVYDGNVWSAATEWTTSSTWSWTPTVANGDYRVGVWVRRAGKSTDAPEVSTSVPFPIAPQETPQEPGSQLR